MTDHKQGLFKAESNEDYHSPNGFFSSSQFKLILDDPVMYYRKYIVGDVPNQKKDYFDVGNAYHTQLLEPEKFDSEFAFYTGKQKRGNDWKIFEEANQGKTILGNKSKTEYEILVNSTKSNKEAMRLLQGGDSEISIYIKMNGFNVKVRFDKLNRTDLFGLDLKSTTGMLIGSKGFYACQSKIAAMDYDLSAALYLDAYNALMDKIKKPECKVSTWYWIFASKEYQQSRVLQASPKMIENGRRKYLLAMESLKKYTENGWKPEQFDDKIELVDPLENDVLESTVEGW